MALISPVFACPKCRHTLKGDDQSVHCEECGSSFPVVDGLYSFNTAHSTHGELSEEEMQRFLSAAREFGWENAVDGYLPAGKAFVYNLIRDPRRRKSVELLDGVKGRVLDFGCGYGGISLVLSQMFDEVVSIDGSNQRISFLNIVKQQNDIKNISIACHKDVLNLPFSDNSFDAAVMVGVLEYLPLSLPNEPISTAHHECLKSFFRILKPGGYLLIQTKNRFGWQFLLGGRDNSGLPFAPVLPIWITDIIHRTLGRGRYRIISYSFAGYRKLMRNSGFNQLKMYWPVPGYQTPDFAIDFDDDILEQIQKIPPEYYPLLKRIALQVLAITGILQYITPNYTILVQKPL